MYVKKSIAVHGFHFMTNHKHANQMKEVRILLSQKSCPDLYSNLLNKWIKTSWTGSMTQRYPYDSKS